METCFDFSRCRRHGFRVYVYPAGGRLSEPQRRALRSLRGSRFYTPEPGRACLLVLPLERGPPSPDARARLARLPHWDGGRNHLLLSLHRDRPLGFEPGRALLAQPSLAAPRFRPRFDVSLPLVPRRLPQRGGARPGPFAAPRRYLLVFKGPSGLGSETRAALHHLHNGRDLLLLPACRPGPGARCDRHAADYAR
ncbi:exostosin glycosyltransferase 1 [Platysternon megacephalum]|uniref:Exostosin glycosyltransferase 1 n=1 Tax=Platysternon megacephalum TaxID=55544 RepID=A0A4D9DZM9_9SAUR|nr:exostosin glycosyltransferase 1 [Platysternon megacephalum]